MLFQQDVSYSINQLMCKTNKIDWHSGIFRLSTIIQLGAIGRIVTQWVTPSFLRHLNIYMQYNLITLSIFSGLAPCENVTGLKPNKKGYIAAHGLNYSFLMIFRIEKTMRMLFT